MDIEIAGDALVTACGALMGYESPKDVGPRGVERGQYSANRAIRAEYTQNHTQDCRAAD